MLISFATVPACQTYAQGAPNPILDPNIYSTEYPCWFGTFQDQYIIDGEKDIKSGECSFYRRFSHDQDAFADGVYAWPETIPTSSFGFNRALDSSDTKVTQVGNNVLAFHQELMELEPAWLRWTDRKNCYGLSNKQFLYHPTPIAYSAIIDFETCHDKEYELVEPTEGNYSIPVQKLPSNLKSIGWSAFQYCQTYEGDTLKIPEGVEEIQAFAFNGIRNLRVVVLPASLKVIDRQAFCNCWNLRAVLLNATVPPLVAHDSFQPHNVQDMNYTLTICVPDEAFYDGSYSIDPWFMWMVSPMSQSHLIR